MACLNVQYSLSCLCLVLLLTSIIVDRTLDWLPSSNTCLVKHAFQSSMALSIRREVNVTRKNVLVIGHDIIGKY